MPLSSLSSICSYHLGYKPKPVIIPPSGSSGLFDISLSNTAKTNMMAMYAFKRCFTAYTGPTVDIRRASDNTTVSFYADKVGNIGTTVDGSGTSLATWLTSTTGYVTTWYDQSGRGKHMTQTTTAYQPQIILNDAGGICTYLNVSMPNGSFQLATAMTGIWPQATTTDLHVNIILKPIVFQPQFTFSLNNLNISTDATKRVMAHIPWDNGNVYWDSPIGSRVNTNSSITVGTKYYGNFYKSNTTHLNGFTLNSTYLTASNSSNPSSSVNCIGLNFKDVENSSFGTNSYIYAFSVYNTSLYSTGDQTVLNNAF